MANLNNDDFKFAELDPEKLAALDLIEKRVCLSRKEDNGSFWVASFPDGQHLSHAGLYGSDNELARFNDPDQAFDAALNPEKYAMHWGKGKF
jgi:hypothetical protein